MNTQTLMDRGRPRIWIPARDMAQGETPEDFIQGLTRARDIAYGSGRGLVAGNAIQKEIVTHTLKKDCSHALAHEAPARQLRPDELASYIPRDPKARKSPAYNPNDASPRGRKPAWQCVTAQDVLAFCGFMIMMTCVFVFCAMLA